MRLADCFRDEEEVHLKPAEAHIDRLTACAREAGAA
jgi:hypothetical protein